MVSPISAVPDLYVLVESILQFERSTGSVTFTVRLFFQGYGVSTYSPAKIDLGGLILGAVIGVGTILIIPKLLYVLSGTYGAYARSKFPIYHSKHGQKLLKITVAT